MSRGGRIKDHDQPERRCIVTGEVQPKAGLIRFVAGPDGTERGKGKLWTPTGGRWFGCLTASELGLSFGRDHVIHGALAAGGLTDKVILEAGRLTGLRGHDGGNTAAGKE